MQRLLITAATACCLTGLFLVYAALSRPFLKVAIAQPKVIAKQHLSILSRPVDNVRMAESHLSQADWAKHAKYHVRTDNIFIYSNEWQPSGSEGYVRFSPFAAIWVQPDRSGQEQVYSIVSESALVKFAANFEMKNPNPGRVVGGALEGTVKLLGPNGLSVEGRSFSFSESLSAVYSDHPVKFAFGPHTGEASKFHADLIPADEGTVQADRPNVVGIRRMLLSRDVKTVMAMPGNSSTTPTASVTIHCSGTLEYLFDELLAIYETDVVAFQQSTATEFDYLRCDKMTVTFEPKSSAELTSQVPATDGAEKVASSPVNTPYQQIETDLEFRKLYAEGKRVTAVSQARELKVQMTSLSYDAKTAQFLLADRKKVEVTQKQTLLQVPEILIQLATGGKIDWVLCRGAGFLENREVDSNRLVFAADWRKHLRKSFDRETGLDLLELEQQASFRQPNRSTALGADAIQVWITPLDSVESLAGSPKGENSKSTGKATKSAGPKPKRMVAEKNVALVSPQLESRAKRLEVVILDSPADSRIGNALANSGTQKPANGITLTEATSTRETGESRPPLDVSADVIQVRTRLPAGVEAPPEMKVSSSRPDVEEVWANGQVRISQPRGEGKPSLELDGQKVHLVNKADLGQMAHVYGSPAHIRDNGIHLEGGTLHLDRNSNLAWVDGPGLLQLPVSRTPDGKKLATPQMLDVWWKDQMTFDGLKAKFDQDVHGALDQTRMKCQRMEVQLDQRISFAQERFTGPSPELKSIHCQQGVEFESYDYADRQLSQVRRAQLWELQLDQQSGKVQGRGPGWMQLWRRKISGEPESAGASVQSQANRPLRNETGSWDYTRVDFAGELQGNTMHRHLTFLDRIEIIFGPVQRPIDTLQVEQLPDAGAWMRCDRLQFSQQALGGTSDDHALQLVASGNSEIEGKSFRARSDQITFDEQKGRYMLRSLGNRKATIWRQGKVGGNVSEVSAQRMEFYPKTSQLKLDGATGADATE